MKRFQFSVSSLLVCMLIVGIIISFWGGLEAESSLQAVWLASILLAYWLSPKTGWHQVLRATGSTAVIWSIAVTWAYVWSHGVRRPSVGELALHGTLVALAGTLIAFAAACLVEGARAVMRYWLRAVWSARIIWTLSLFLFIGFLSAAWMTKHLKLWEPALVLPVGDARLQGVLSGEYVNERAEDIRMHSIASADAKFIAAILNGHQRIRIYDAHTNNDVASFNAPNGEWFGDLTFTPDSNMLAALLYSKTESPKLLRWDLPSSTSRTPVSLDGLLDGAEGGERTSFSLDQCLLVAYARPVNEQQANVRICTVDLLNEPIDPHSFTSVTIELELPIVSPHSWILELPGTSGLWFVSPDSWMASDDAKKVTLYPRGKGTSRSYLFQATGATTILPGRPLGFVPKTDLLLINEGSTDLALRHEYRSGAPPFWLKLRRVWCWRLVAFDCQRNETIAQSRWFTKGNTPRMTLDRSRVLAQQDRSVLIWVAPR